MNFRRLVSTEGWRLIFRKIKKQTDPSRLLHSLHSSIVYVFFGAVKNPYSTFYISEEGAQELKAYLDSLPEIKMSKNLSKHKQNYVRLGEPDEFYKEVNADVTYFDVRRSSEVDKLLRLIESDVSDYLGSPYAVVNLLAWKTRPNAIVRKRGPNRFHKDGFPPGHAKCMIYVNPLNKAMGFLEIEKDQILSDRGGLTVLFQNSDVSHKSVPGTDDYRYTVDITLQRTLVSVDITQDYESRPGDLYFLSPLRPYRT